MSIPKIGLQLHTLKGEFATDPYTTLRLVASVGFEGVEFVGSSLRKCDPEKIKQELRQSGMQAAGIAFEIEELESEIESILLLCHSINCATLVMPSIRANDCVSRSSLVDVALKMNYIASKCKTEGVAFLYHMHGVELSSVEGRSALEWLSGCWDSQLVRIEADTYWIERAGVNVLDFLKQYGNQCSSIHVRDTADKSSWREVEIGTGVIDMNAVVNEVLQHDVGWLIVEQEEFSKTPMECVRSGFENLFRIVNEVRHLPLVVRSSVSPSEYGRNVQ